MVRQRVVDDVDPAIQYSPQGWFAADPKTLDVGNFGPIFNSTSHATTTTNSSLAFAFNGTSIDVLGSIIVKTTDNVTDPSWECFVDEIAIPQPDPAFQFPENNWELCKQDTITPGPHTLRIVVKSAGQAFYLDYIRYTPLETDTFDSAVLVYPNTDASISFSEGWGSFGGENATDVMGAQVALNLFHGTSVSMYGFVPKERPRNATWATYTIDGGAPVNFTLDGLAPGDVPTEYNVLLFATPPLVNKVHNLVVTHGGDLLHTPLVFTHFLVTNTSSASSASVDSSPPPSSSSDSAAPEKEAPVGAIAGGVIAGVFILSVLAVVLFFLRRRRQRAAAASASVSNTRTSPSPFSSATATMVATDVRQSRVPVSASAAPRSSYAYSPISRGLSPVRRHPSGTSRATWSDLSGDASHGSFTYPSASGFSDAGASGSSPLHRHPGSDVPGPTSDVSSLGGGAGASAADGRSLPLSAHVSHSGVGADAVPAKLAREAAASALLLRTSPTPSSPPSGHTIVLQHEDSGVRLRPPSAPPEVVEVPPGYSVM